MVRKIYQTKSYRKKNKQPRYVSCHTYHHFFLKYFLPKFTFFFEKYIARFQNSIVNCQPLTPRLTTKFSSVTQHVPIQNFFVMSFFDIFSQWKKLDTKNQGANPSKMKFPTANCKITRKRLLRYSFILSINGQPLL